MDQENQENQKNQKSQNESKNFDLIKYLNNITIKTKERERESWDSYFKRLAMVIAERSTCIHRKVGAVIVKDKRILATGYNQPPSGFPHCDQIDCIRDDLNIPSGKNQEICYGLHAEQNALMQAAKFGISTEGATIYVTHKPCSVCARLIVNAGIKRVVYIEDYPDPLTDFFFKMCGIELIGGGEIEKG
ncbi:MAG: deoxycytidylate deaminase [Fervidobacterium sp.]